MKRDAVLEIIRYNQGFDRNSLRRKLEAMCSAPFEFFRATSHLFALDVGGACEGPKGLILGDLHAENFGTYRAVSNKIVYDINDFDDCTQGAYEYDLRRLLASLVIGGEQAKLPVSACVAACEAAVDEYLSSIRRFRKAKRRKDFEKLEPTSAVKRLLSVASEKSRVAMLRELVSQDRKSGAFQFRGDVRKFAPLDKAQRAAIEKAVSHCKVPAGADPSHYVFEDAVFRFAGKGSLGRQRYAILLRKGIAAREDFSAMRLIEWKESFDSPLHAAKPARREQSKRRAKDLVDASLQFQMDPKRYCGYTTVSGRPFQTREIGANDDRFSPKQYAVAARLASAAKVFGGITARAHLLSSLGDQGPRELTETGRFGRRMVALALEYAEQTQRDYAVFCQRREEVRKAWKV